MNKVDYHLNVAKLKKTMSGFFNNILYYFNSLNTSHFIVIYNNYYDAKSPQALQKNKAVINVIV